MTEPRTPSAGTALPTLTSLRFFGALLVFVVHLTTSPYQWEVLRPFQFGYAAVAFFFVLSGFVLCWSAKHGTSAKDFFVKRLARLYPTHLACFTVLAVLVALGAGDFVYTGVPETVTNLTLTHAWWPGYRMVEGWVGPSWSLSAEAFFYVLFPGALVLTRRWSWRRQGHAIAALFAVVIAAWVLLRGHFGLVGASVVYFNPLARLPEFLLGIWLATGLRTGHIRRTVPLWLPLGLLLVGSLASWRLLLPYYPLPDYVLLPGLALLIVAAAQRDQVRSGGLLRHPVALWLGELTFAFYLVHDATLKLLLPHTGWGRTWSGAAGAAPFAVMFLACLAVAAVFHHGVEKPAQAAITGWWRRRHAGRAALAAS